MMAMLPQLGGSRTRLPEVLPPIGPKRARVALFLGCVADAMYPETNAATARVLQQNGCEVVIPRAQACCGAIHYHSGVEEPALALARRNLRAFNPDELDAIIVNAAGCGAMLKDYPHLLPAAEHDQAARFVAKVKDISEFLVALGPVAPENPVPLKVTYHDACHLCHGQQIRVQPRQLLAMIPGLELVPLEESEICCGAAGTYNLTQPEMSERLGVRKMDNIAGHRRPGRRHRQRRLHPPDRPQDQGTRQPRSRSSIQSICSTGRTEANEPEESIAVMSMMTTRPPGRTTTTLPGETRILVPGASWRLYQTFVEMLPEGSRIRTAFDGRDMEIMVTGPVHGHFADLLDQFVKAVAGALGIRLKPMRETTWIRPEIERGIEADNCYYLDPAKIATVLAALSRGSNNVADYPNPDLAIEVDISVPEADRAGIYSAMGVAEFWRFDGRTLCIERLDQSGRYQAAEASGFLPLRADQVPRWLIDEDLSDYEAWTRRVRAWADKDLRG